MAPCALPGFENEIIMFAARLNKHVVILKGNPLFAHSVIHHRGRKRQNPEG
jgi:hypothetical protein